MEVTCTPVKVSEADIRRNMDREGKFNFNHLLVRNKEISRVELRYVEYFVMKYAMVHQKGFFRRSQGDEVRQNVWLLGNGSTGAVSFMDTLPAMETADLDPAAMQRADCGVDSMASAAKMTLVKMFRRTLGGRLPRFELLEYQSLYRPFWLIYYGQPRKDGRTLCSVRGADGYQVGKL